MRKKIIVALSMLFLFGTITSAVYAKDTEVHKTKTIQTYSTVDPDTEH